MKDPSLGEQAIAQIEAQVRRLPTPTKRRLLGFSEMVRGGGPGGMCASYAYWLTKEDHPRWVAIIEATYRKGLPLSQNEFDAILSATWNDVLKRIFPPEIIVDRYPQLAE